MASATSEGGVAVWEWQNEFSRWRPYEPHVSHYIEQHNKNRATWTASRFVSLSQADRSLSVYQLDLGSMQQTRHDTGTSRPVRRCVYSHDSPAGQGVVWQWEGDHPNQWHSYDLDVAGILEDAHSKGIPKVDLRQTACQLPYTVDLLACVQTRAQSGFTRKIRRPALHTPYSATTDKPGTINAGPSAFGRSAVTASSFPPSFGSANSFTSFSPFAAPVFGGSSLPSTSTVPAAGPAPVFPAAPLDLSSTGFGSTAPAPPLSHAPPPGGIAAGRSGPVPSRLKKSQKATSSVITKMSTGKKSKPSMRTAASLPNPPAPHTVTGSGLSMVPGGSSVASTMPGMMFPHSSVPPMYASLPPMPMPSSSCAFSSRGHTSMSSVIPEKRSRMCSIPNTASTSNPNDALKHYVAVVKDPPGEEDCCICCETLDSPSGYGGDNAEIVEKLRKCGHMFHQLCIHAMYKSGTKDGSLQCPTCKTMNGVKYGNCPPGHMNYCTLDESLPGHEGYGTFSITYHISAGVQTAGHPNPGQGFSARGFPRRGYIPCNEQGQKVFNLLLKAWERRLTFTIGTSATTGEPDTVVWNEIHHKTEFQNHHGHGYPDPNYLDNLTMELSIQGVTDSDDEADDASS